jgi:hypothetical protein
MPHRINPAMNAVETLRLDATPAAAIVNSGALELRDRDDAMLARRNSGNETVTGDFPSHVGR